MFSLERNVVEGMPFVHSAVRYSRSKDMTTSYFSKKLALPRGYIPRGERNPGRYRQANEFP